MAKKLDIGAVLAENIGFLRTLLLAPDDGFAGLPARLQALALFAGFSVAWLAAARCVARCVEA